MSTQKSSKQTKSNGNGGSSGIVECSKVNAQKITFTELDTKNARSSAQSIAYPNYEYVPGQKKNFIFKTDTIKLNQYGIPMMNDKTKEWIKSDQDREYFRVGHDESQPACNAFFKMLADIDKRVVELQPVIFGASASKYKYVPLIKEPTESEDSEDNDKATNGKPKAPKMNFCKVKFDTDYNDGRKIKTAIFVNENKKPVLQENVDTVSDVAQHLTWNSSARFVIMMNKLWAEKVPKKGKGQPKEFGISMKCLQLEVTEKSEMGGSLKEQFRTNCVFGGEDDEETTGDANNETDNQDEDDDTDSKAKDSKQSKNDSKASKNDSKNDAKPDSKKTNKPAKDDDEEQEQEEVEVEEDDDDNTEAPEEEEEQEEDEEEEAPKKTKSTSQKKSNR